MLATMVRTSWSTDPWTLGSYSFLGVGATPQLRATLAEPLSGGALHLAGEHVATTSPATVNGAAESGNAAADRILDDVDGPERIVVVGAGMGAVTAWLEATHEGARGAEFVRGPMERILHAAQAWWAYLSMWTWPADLVFVHPPFAGGEGRAWTALGAGCAVAVAAVLAARRGHRWAMVAFLTYSAGVFPALGFVNLYPLRYAPVADHFAYVATVTLAACSGAAGSDATCPCATGSSGIVASKRIAIGPSASVIVATASAPDAPSEA
jgi:hypothetical protein